MKFIADLQIHSRFARATSKNINLKNLEKWAKIKGLDLLGTGDFQHPEWNKEIKTELKEDENGILWSRDGFPFIWQSEVSLMFSAGGKRRAIHLLIFAPNQKLTDEIIKYLASKGRLDYDGRPIFGISGKQFVKDLKEINDQIEIIPAHCMTPWFGLFGSDSGFNSIRECFEEMSEHIYAVESGMSASPDMLWRFDEISSGKVRVVSFSDAHSFWPWRLGREATVFDFDKLSYKNFIKAIRTGEGLDSTIETPPEYGKYHWDGHRNCNFSCSPQETKKLNSICPVCRKKLTIGVEYRVEEIAIKENGYKLENPIKFYKIAPLHELIAFAFKTSMNTKKAWGVYNNLISKFGSELNILLNVSQEEFLKNEFDKKLIELILLGRKGKLKVKPGFDGEYGLIELEEKQKTLV